MKEAVLFFKRQPLGIEIIFLYKLFFNRVNDF